MWQFLVNKASAKADDLSFWEHADILRKYIIRSLILVIIFSIGAFFLKDFLFNEIILAPKNTGFVTYQILCSIGKLIGYNNLCVDSIPVNLINIEMGGQLRWHIVISLVAGFIAAFPFVVLQLWLFVKPALTFEERKHAGSTIFFIIFLFITGLFFGYYIILPLTINFLANYQLSPEIINQFTIRSYISTVTWLPLSTGIVFELPVLVYFLTKIGLLSAAFLKRNRKYSILIILIVAGLITPSTDMFSQLLVSLPLFFLYELSIIIATRISLKQNLSG